MTEDQSNPPALPTSWDGSPKELLTLFREYYTILLVPQPDDDHDYLAAFFTPYQFTLPVLQALYHQIQPDLGINPNLEVLRNGITDLTKASEERGNPPVLSGRNPPRRSKAVDAPLRAIAYFSWENESRTFLVRRVYPTYFDFLAVSHVPEGWGAASAMLEHFRQLQADPATRTEIRNGAFYTVVRAREDTTTRFTLRYAAEMARLKYAEIVVVPVFRATQAAADESDLLGAYLFFVNAVGINECNTQKGEQYRKFLGHLAEATAKVIALHDQALGHNPSALWETWKERREVVGEAAKVLQVRLEAFTPGSDKTAVEDACRAVLRRLAKPEYFALRGEGTEIFVITREDLKPVEFQQRVLNELLAVLGSKSVRCSLNLRDFDTDAQVRGLVIEAISQRPG